MLSVRWQDFFFVEKYISCYYNGDDSKEDSQNESNITESNIIKKELVLFFDDFERCKIDIIDLMGAINEYLESKNIKVVIIADEDKIDADEEKRQYLDFKEKLISRTIQIKSDYIFVIKSIVHTYSETAKGYKEFLERNQEIIYELFVESGIGNLRSVKSFIMDYERIYDAWHNSNVPLDMEFKVFYMFGA